jgi:hypothetical protein
MKIVDLNNYEENDGLRDKLRKRMDTHEPELSDSVWDRIHHEMDRREANRKKRFLWWFSSVAVVVLTSGIVSFLVLKNAGKSEVVAQNTKEIIFSSPDNPNSEIITLSQDDDETGGNSSGETENTSNTISNSSFNNGNLVPPVPTPTNYSFEQGNTPNNSVETEDNSVTKEPTEKLETKGEEIVPDATTELPKKEEATPKNDKEQAIALPVKEEKQDDNKKTKKAKAASNFFSKRWFVGVNYSFNQTYRTATDINPKFYYPSTTQRNKYEKRGYSSSYGLEVGFYPTKNFFIKSGVGIFNMAENVSYDVKVRKDSSNRAGVPDNYGDSIAPGNSINKRNTYNYVQIPFEIGYSRDISKRISLYFSGGVALNILQGYNYYFYEAIFGSEITRSDKLEYNDMFKNYIMLSGGLGGQYRIGENWAATFGVNYRRAITSSANKEYEVDVRPYSIGVTTGLAYKF